MRQQTHWLRVTNFGLLALILVNVVACSKPRRQPANLPVAFWTCAMHPSIRSDGPGKCPICGMDLVQVSNEKDSNAPHSGFSEFVVPIERQQRIGVTYTEVRRRPLRAEIRSVGTLD